MNQSVELQIKECEERLRQAMLQSDLAALDALLAPDLIFTNHLGRLMTKQDDLKAHESGILKIEKLSLSNQKIKVNEGVVVVSVQAHVSGSFNGEASESNIRFTRVWSKTSNGYWQVIVGHSSIVV